MQLSIADKLWGTKARTSYLILAAIVLLFTFLGAREIWTQEHRWADIVSGMFYRHDFFHPYLGENQYYDKPLLSYWLISFITQLTGILSTWSLRLPSALAGLLAIWSIYQLGVQLKDKSLGLLSGWLLLTTFYFIFWARTSSADMLNLAGSLFAIAWYMSKRESAHFFDYAIFFMIIALTCLCKGLVGAIVPLLAVLVDIILQKSWKQHCRLSLLLAFMPALFIYLLPFWLSSYFGGKAYGESGLYLVYRENVLRYFQPFDHEGPIYTYLIYLPVYLLPWTLFFVPALLSLYQRWKSMSLNAKWIVWTVFILFLFFTLSGSRRSYYILPVVPFAILLTADWILSYKKSPQKLYAWTAGIVLASFVLIFVTLDLAPAWYYSLCGTNRFAALLKQEAEKIQPWKNFNVVLLDAESKLNFYLQLPPDTKNYQIKGTKRTQQTQAMLAQTWPILQKKPANTIFITRKLYEPELKIFFIGYHVVALEPINISFLRNDDMNASVAFIPNR
ncbi:MAG: glycosyltransferase family 39 protein [Gammaproteobacteria bacterium]|nr:glycosyltransferase family 39 protein [Gammaproteobacteria bacterium]